MLTPGDSVCVRLTYKMAKFRSKSFANVQFDLDIKGTLPSSRLPGVIKEQLMSFSYKFAGVVPIYRIPRVRDSISSSGIYYFILFISVEWKLNSQIWIEIQDIPGRLEALVGRVPVFHLIVLEAWNMDLLFLNERNYNIDAYLSNATLLL